MIRRTLTVAVVHFAIGAALLLVFNQQPWSVSAALTLGFPFVWVCDVARCPDWLSVQPWPLIEAAMTYALSSVTWGVVIGTVWTLLAEARMDRERGLVQ